MAKHTQTIRWQIADELSVFDHFVKLALKGLIYCTKIYNKATIYVNVLKLTPFSPFDLKCKKT